MAAAYSATGAAWREGPELVYRRLAAVLVERCPGGVAGEVVADLGAGTGAVGRVLLDAGAARVVAVDASVGMLRAGLPGGVAGDLLALPFRDGRFGAAVAAFSLNHLADPAAGLREAARVVAPGGGIVAGAYAADDDHPAKAAVEDAATALGWTCPAWYRWVRTHAAAPLSTVDGARSVLAATGLAGSVEAVRVPVDVDPPGMVAWRLGMAQLAPWVAGLDAARRRVLVADALDRLGDPPPLVRSVVVIVATAGGGAG